uniref:phosphatidylinositol 3-kinase n=1 Tax=Plasmodium vivax TaxID=5855 RepID=A0A2P1DPF9_PLAVI|nr:phosphatidylinositol-3-kinase [Plasmodium vivax]AVK70160.1 phosphatidylinositol-3-kinase [Plasmodium vivax]AVK70164.1 phosphatidylinositol-3-kinase [Plasmodium vivax]AVK70166.1 phosphatidylinositol-3-kinase [Plasmodium vivax]AVK70167.1 phosphatidylinositol-3-kinase [Plasmodium vivax]
MKPLTPQQRKMSSANVKDVDDYFSVRLSLFTVFKGRHGSGVRGRRRRGHGRTERAVAPGEAASSPPGEEANEADSSNAANPADAADAANGGDKTALLRKMRRLEKFKYLQRKRKKKHLMSVSADGKERVLPGRRDSKRRVPPVKSKGATARVRAGLTSGVDYKLNRKRREAPDGKDGKYGKYADEEKIPRDEFEAICYLLMDREFYGHPVSIPCGGLDRRGSHSANQRSDDCMNRFNHLGEGLGKPARVKKDARKSCGDRIAEDLAQMVRASDRSGSAAGGKRKTAKREMADRETGEGEPFCEKPVGGNCPSSGGEPPAGAAAKGESSSGGHSDSHSDGHSDHSPTMPRNRKSEAIRNHLHTINRTLSYPIRHSQLSPDTYLFFLIQHREKKHRTFYAYCRVFSRTGVLKQGLQIKKLFHLGRKARIQDIITSALRKKIAYVDDDSCGRGTSHQGIISFLQENCVYRDLLCLYRLPRKGGFPIGGGSLENARSGASPPRSAKRHGQLICPIEGGPPPHRRRSDAFYQSMKRCSRIERYVRSVRKIYFGWGSPVGNYVHAGDHREVKEGNAKGGRHCGLTWGETPIREQQGKHNSCVSFGEANLGEKRKKKIMTSQVKRLRRKVRRYEGELFCAGGRASHECAQPGHPRRPRHPGHPLEECTPKRSRVAATLRRISEMYAQWKTKEERHIAGFLFFHFFFFNKRCVYYGDKRVGGNEVGRNEVGRDEVGRDRVGSDLGESCPSSCPPDERSSWFFNSFDYVGEAGGASSVARAFLKRVKRQRGEAAQYGEEAPRGVSPQNASPHNASPPRKEKRRNDIFEHMNRYASRISKNIHLANRSRHDDYPFDFSLQKGEGGWHDSIDTAPAMEEIKTITTILNTPVIKLSEAEKKCLWKFRLQLVNREEALGKFLKSVNWDDQQEKEEATELLNCWSKPCLENCLELLNGHLHRAVIKKYVMQIIEQAKKDQLKLYLFQLVQSLRVFNHEPIDSLFMDTLINKCITSKKLSIFLHWFLLSETKDKCKGNLYIHIHKLFITKLMTSNLRKKKKILSILKNQNRFRNQLLYLTKIAKRKSERIHNKTKKLRQFLFCYRQNYGCVVIKDFIKNNIFLSDSEVYDFASPQPRPGAPPGGGEAGEVEGEEGGEVEAEEAEAEGETPDVRNSVYYLNGELSIRADPAADAYCFQYEPRGAHFSQGAAPPAQRSTSDVSTEDSKTVNYIDDSRGAPIERNRDTSFFSNLLQLNDNFDFFLSATYSDEDNHIDILDDSISLVRKQKIKKIRAPLILPIDPDIEFLSFLPEQSYVLRSSLYPIVIACLVRKKIKLAHEHFHNLIINEQKYLKKNVKKKKNYSMYHEVNSKFLKSLYSSFDCASDFERHYRKVKWEGKNIFYNGRKVERVGLQNWGPRDGEESAKVAPTEVAPSNAASAEAAPPSAGVVIHHESETNPQSKQRVKKYNEIYELSIKRYIYKAGDDLRQDHLVIQIICIIDNIWKRYGLDLKLTLYKVLALSTDDGFIEFVNYAESISSIKKNYKGEIRQYFIEMSTDSKSPLGFDAIILDNFISSCAGYSVITYLLGIGDRHLDNLMVSRDGCFFHIDFGYIFGEDPKPFSPPMKLCKEMIEAMGGAHSVGYEQFLKKCCLAYKYLRYHSKLIISLLDCMCESGLKDMKMSPELCVLKVQEKFRLDLNDEAAEVYFLSVINASVKTLFPVVVDKLHEWALNWK